MTIAQITGEALIGGVALRGAGNSFKAWNPAKREHMEPAFHMVDVNQIDQACSLAGKAFDVFRNTTDEERAAFLDTVAEQIMALGDALVERAMAETGLPRAVSTISIPPLWNCMKQGGWMVI